MDPEQQLHTHSRLTDITGQTETSELETCLFPVLDDGTKGDKEAKYVDIDIGIIYAACTFCKENNFTLGTLLAATWSIVLHQYAETDLVCFGVKVVAAQVPIEEALRTNNLDRNVKICKFPVKAETHVKDLLVFTENHIRRVHLTSECDTRFNSWLLLRDRLLFDEEADSSNEWGLSHSGEVTEVSIYLNSLPDDTNNL